MLLVLGSMSWSSSLSLSLIVWNHFPYGVRYARSSRGGSVTPGYRGTDSNTLWVKVSIGPIHHTELCYYIFICQIHLILNNKCMLYFLCYFEVVFVLKLPTMTVDRIA